MEFNNNNNNISLWLDFKTCKNEINHCKKKMKDIKIKIKTQLFYNYNILNCTNTNTFLINEKNINTQNCVICNNECADVYGLQLIPIFTYDLNDRMIFNFCKSCYINKINDFIFLDDGSNYREKLLYFKVIEKEILYLFESDISAT